MLKEKQVEINGFKVNVCNFGYATYLYPAFNGDQEFRASHKGFRQLSHYLRTVRWVQQKYNELFNSSTKEAAK